jgi:glucose-6-phosphate 1-dehydrogenase
MTTEGRCCLAQIIPVEKFDFVVFGATGDLTLRKLLPALYYRFRDQQMPQGARVIGVARSAHDDADYRAMATEALNHFVSRMDLDEATLRAFLDSIFYVQLDGTSGEGWESLVDVLGKFPERIRVFYMATSPDLYGAICRNIQANDLASARSRVVLEKPIGHDLKSALAINEQVGAIFSEQQTYRIDHYLGKETVQNLLALRFANSIFERLWNSDAIDHVQVTVAETVGVEGRAGYYDKSGQLRDMVQNHLLQLVCLLAMESPISMSADAVRDEKLKVLRALKPIAAHEVAHVSVRGQYAAGAIGGKSVASYAQDLGHESETETFAAIKAEIRSWRWAGVPFYLRTGKRLAEKVSEIVVQFRAVPFSMFPRDAGDFEPNRLVIRLQPDEGIRLEVMVKDPGPGGMRLRATRLNISFEEAFNTRYPDAYERLLMDAVRGNQTLFMRRDEVEAAWNWVEPILQGWAEAPEHPRLYPAGSWGPTSAIALIERDGRTWHEEFS